MFEKRKFALDCVKVTIYPSIDMSVTYLHTAELERKCTNVPYSKATLQLLLERFKNEKNYEAYWSDMDGNRIDETSKKLLRKRLGITIISKDL